MRGCEEPGLVTSQESKVHIIIIITIIITIIIIIIIMYPPPRVYRVGRARTNLGNRDYNIRYCDQSTAGGGWTVRLSTHNLHTIYTISTQYLHTI